MELVLSGFSILFLRKGASSERSSSPSLSTDSEILKINSSFVVPMLLAKDSRVPQIPTTAFTLGYSFKFIIVALSLSLLQSEESS